jgi:hypothetical protein
VKLGCARAKESMGYKNNKNNKNNKEEAKYFELYELAGKN